MKWLYVIYSDDVIGEKNRKLKNYLFRNKIPFGSVEIKEDEHGHIVLVNALISVMKTEEVKP